MMDATRKKLITEHLKELYARKVHVTDRSPTAAELVEILSEGMYADEPYDESSAAATYRAFFGGQHQANDRVAM